MNVKSPVTKAPGRLCAQGDPLGAANGFHAFDKVGAVLARDQDLVFLAIVDCRGHGGNAPTIHSPCACRQGWPPHPDPKGAALPAHSGCRKYSAFCASFSSSIPAQSIGLIVTHRRHSWDSAICSNPNRKAVNPRFVGQASRGGKSCSNRKHAQRVLTHAVTRDNL